jgi:hypothetical protein
MTLSRQQAVQIRNRAYLTAPQAFGHHHGSAKEYAFVDQFPSAPVPIKSESVCLGVFSDNLFEADRGISHKIGRAETVLLKEATM